MESEQATSVDSIKDVVQSSVKVPEFDKHLKKARGHIGRNIVEITNKMKAIVWKPLIIKKTSIKTGKKKKNLLASLFLVLSGTPKGPLVLGLLSYWAAANTSLYVNLALPASHIYHASPR